VQRVGCKPTRGEVGTLLILSHLIDNGKGWKYFFDACVDRQASMKRLKQQENTQNPRGYKGDGEIVEEYQTGSKFDAI